MSFQEYLKTRWPRDNELISALGKFTITSAAMAIQMLSVIRKNRGMDPTVHHYERASIQADWRDFVRYQNEHSARA